MFRHTLRVQRHVLGLAVARSAIEANGGRVWAESAVGKGSTFVIEIPAGEDLDS